MRKIFTSNFKVSLGLMGIIALLACQNNALGQSDSSFVTRTSSDTSKLILNMDAVYNRPFLEMDKMPLAVGGYVEVNTQYMGTDGISEGLSFQMRRTTLFFSSTIHERIKFLSEIEFEDGTKEINIEFASIDLELHPLFNLRGGIVMNPIGAFNQNHDGPKWEFVDRPISATQLLSATWSNVGFGVHGKYFHDNWAFAYETYLTNGFDNSIIANGENKTYLPAAKQNQDRFEESNNGIPLLTSKVAMKNRKIGEIGLSYMGGVYNKFEEDGLILDRKRRVDVWAVDFNTTLPTQTYVNGEVVFIEVDVPTTYSQQFGNRQWGGFLDLVQPVFKGSIFGFARSILNAALRLEYVDWNAETFNETGGEIADDVVAIVPAISWRPGGQTVLRLNYRYHWQRDLPGNPSALTAGWQFGISSYF